MGRQWIVVLEVTSLPDIFIGFWSASPWASQEALVVKNPPANAGDVRVMGSVPGVGRSPGGGHGNPLQYSSLENHVDRAAWWAIQSMGSQRVRHN